MVLQLNHTIDLVLKTRGGKAEWYASRPSLKPAETNDDALTPQMLSVQTSIPISTIATESKSTRL